MALTLAAASLTAPAACGGKVLVDEPIGADTSDTSDTSATTSASGTTGTTQTTGTGTLTTTITAPDYDCNKLLQTMHDAFAAATVCDPATDSADCAIAMVDTCNCIVPANSATLVDEAYQAAYFWGVAGCPSPGCGPCSTPTYGYCDPLTKRCGTPPPP